MRLRRIVFFGMVNLILAGELVAAQGIALEYSEEIAPAKGAATRGKITLLLGQAAELLATLAHERRTRSCTFQNAAQRRRSAFERRKPRPWSLLFATQLD